MEGALAGGTKREEETNELVDTIIIISHFHFYCYVGWRRSELEYLYSGTMWENAIRGLTVDTDDNFWPAEDGDTTMFSLCSQA